MEPNKFDKKFRKALQEHEIAPTPAAWDRLDAMLTVAEEKKAAPTYNWLYIAASILGFIAIAVVFLSKTQPLEDVRRDDIVYENNKPVESKDSLKDQKQTEIVIPKPSESVAETTQNNPSKQPIKSNHTNLKTNPILDKQINQNQLQQKNEAIANQSNQTNKQQRKGESIITRAEGELAAGNQKTQQPNQLSNPISITNQQQLAHLESNPKLGKTPIKVSASNLLSEVDGELQLSFREKVINSIDKNYKTVKVALANRNNQSDINQ
ncbi:hypothetical protein [Flavobacterium sp.]|uniref:hypothetical protein n=1 Tax=Flavobacterium sp. TaxID=239 RepID=UPI002620A9A8|nr:hypothetical protein [Flavobacterium sp.]